MSLEEELREQIHARTMQSTEAQLADIARGEEIAVDWWRLNRLLLDKANALEGAILRLARELDAMQGTTSTGQPQA